MKANVFDIYLLCSSILDFKFRVLRCPIQRPRDGDDLVDFKDLPLKAQLACQCGPYKIVSIRYSVLFFARNVKNGIILK